MKRTAIIIGLAGLASVARAQLATGPAGLLIKAGTTFSSEGLVLTPATDLTLQNDTIRLSGTAVSTGTGASIARVYTIAPSLTFSGTLGIQYTAPELNGNQEGTLSVLNASPGAGFLSFISTASNNNSYYVYKSGMPVVTLNRITATSASVPLPIRYHSFTAVPGPSCSIVLSWSAAQAQADHFRVERSADGKTFNTVPAPVSRSDEQFSLTDAAPLPGRNIYRLAIAEEGEPLLYSNVITIADPCAMPAQLKIYPNPANDAVTVILDHLQDGAATIDLLDITGNVLKTFSVASTENTLDLQSIAPGSYVLRIHNGSLQESVRILKL